VPYCQDGCLFYTSYDLPTYDDLQEFWVGPDDPADALPASAVVPDFLNRAATCWLHNCQQDYYYANPWTPAPEDDPAVYTIEGLCETGCIHACRAECDLIGSKTFFTGHVMGLDHKKELSEKYVAKCKEYNCDGKLPFMSPLESHRIVSSKAAEQDTADFRFGLLETQNGHLREHKGRQGHSFLQMQGTKSKKHIAKGTPNPAKKMFVTCLALASAPHVHSAGLRNSNNILQSGRPRRTTFSRRNGNTNSGSTPTTSSSIPYQCVKRNGMSLCDKRPTWHGWRNRSKNVKIDSKIVKIVVQIVILIKFLHN